MNTTEPMATSLENTPAWPPCSIDQLPNGAFTKVAEYFRTLSEPIRLQILCLLRKDVRNVGELAQELSTSLPNMSRHLNHLCKAGFITRQSRGTSVYYRINDMSVFALCDVVCASIASRMEQEQNHWRQ